MVAMFIPPRLPVSVSDDTVLKMLTPAAVAAAICLGPCSQISTLSRWVTSLVECYEESP